MTRIILFTLIVVTIAIGAASAGEFDLGPYSVAAGGGLSSAADFEFRGTMGQPDAGAEMSGGDFSLTGGLWSVVPNVAPCGGVSPCDTNCDGSVNLFDIESFVSRLVGATTGCSPCAADANADGSVNLFDIDGFVQCLTG